MLKALIVLGDGAYRQQGADTLQRVLDHRLNNILSMLQVIGRCEEKADIVGPGSVPQLVVRQLDRTPKCHLCSVV